MDHGYDAVWVQLRRVSGGATNVANDLRGLGNYERARHLDEDTMARFQRLRGRMGEDAEDAADQRPDAPTAGSPRRRDR